MYFFFGWPELYLHEKRPFFVIIWSSFILDQYASSPKSMNRLESRLFSSFDFPFIISLGVNSMWSFMRDSCPHELLIDIDC